MLHPYLKKNILYKKKMKVFIAKFITAKQTNKQTNPNEHVTTERNSSVCATPQLLHLGREYPKGADYFRGRLRAAFAKNKSVQNPEQIKELIARGEYVTRELEALYSLRKYRTMKKRYYEE